MYGPVFDLCKLFFYVEPNSIFLFLQVGYPTALDVFIIICFVTVFAALVEFAILNFIDTLIRRIKKRDKERRQIAMALNQNQNSFYIHPDNGFTAVPPRKLERKDSVVDNDAMLEVEDENLLTPEESPTHEQQQWATAHENQQWETIETMVFNGNEATLVPK